MNYSSGLQLLAPLAWVKPPICYYTLVKMMTQGVSVDTDARHHL